MRSPLCMRTAVGWLSTRTASSPSGASGQAFTTELVVSELVTNVIRHASGPITLRLLRDRSLTVEVSDEATTAPHLRHARIQDENGRGLFIIAALTSAGALVTRTTARPCGRNRNCTLVTGTDAAAAEHDGPAEGSGMSGRGGDAMARMPGRRRNGPNHHGSATGTYGVSDGPRPGQAHTCAAGTSPRTEVGLIGVRRGSGRGRSRRPRRRLPRR